MKNSPRYRDFCDLVVTHKSDKNEPGTMSHHVRMTFFGSKKFFSQKKIFFSYFCAKNVKNRSKTIFSTPPPSTPLREILRKISRVLFSIQRELPLTRREIPWILSRIMVDKWGFFDKSFTFYHGIIMGGYGRVEWTEKWVNPLIGLRGLRGINSKNGVPTIESVVFIIESLWEWIGELNELKVS